MGGGDNNLLKMRQASPSVVDIGTGARSFHMSSHRCIFPDRRPTSICGEIPVPNLPPEYFFSFLGPS